jgi:hypothetical protein
LQGNLPTAWVRDLLIHGDDLVAATQGRAIWSLGDLALLRQTEPGARLTAPRLFAPAVAVVVRPNNTHDTPLPAEEPAGENPPSGVVIDYALAAPAKGPVTLDIVDPSGARVARLTSQATPPPDAERYFNAAWVRPAAPLATAAGAHRAVWNLRWSRPKSLAFDFSIAAAAGTDTPISPQGALALPGDYQVVLNVDGASARAPLKLIADPRSAASPSDLAAILALSRTIADDLARARRAYGEIDATHDAMAAVAAKLKTAQSAGPLVNRVDVFVAATAPAVWPAAFLKDSKILAALETDLEGADLAPTQPQLDTRREVAARLDERSSAWTALRDGELAALNAELAHAGLGPVTPPRDDQLSITVPDDGGGDLP